MWPWPLTFWPNIKWITRTLWQVLWLWFHCFGFIMRTDRQTDAQTDADERFAPTTLVGVSNKNVISVLCIIGIIIIIIIICVVAGQRVLRLHRPDASKAESVCHRLQSILSSNRPPYRTNVPTSLSESGHGSGVAHGGFRDRSPDISGTEQHAASGKRPRRTDIQVVQQDAEETSRWWRSAVADEETRQAEHKQKYNIYTYILLIMIYCIVVTYKNCAAFVTTWL